MPSVADISEGLSNKLRNMSFFCTVLIVSMHIGGAAARSGQFVGDWVAHGIAQIGVPFFFMTSGFLLLNHVKQENWWARAVVSRLGSLVVPFFALNVLYFPIKYGIHFLGTRYFGADGTNPNMEFSWLNFLINISPVPVKCGPCIVPLWYLRALFYLVFCCPLYMWWLRKSRTASMLFLASIFSLWMVQGVARDTYGILVYEFSYEFNLNCLFHFSLGMVLRLWSRELIIRPRRILGVGALGLGLLGHYICLKCGKCAGAHALGAMKNLFLICGFWAVIPSRALPKILTDNTFVVYVLHFPVIYVCDACLKAIGGGVFKDTFYGFGAFLVISIGSSILLGKLVRLWFPRLQCILFGGR